MENITFYDIKKPPFKIYGLYNPCSEDIFRRVPEEVARATSPKVHYLHTQTAGGRIRFKTDSDVLIIRSRGSEEQTYHHAPVNRHGYDVYIDGPRGGSYMGCTKPDVFALKEYEALIYLIGKGEKEITVNMPLYGSVYDVSFGLREGASLSEHSPYKYEKPVVFYGSSITQGACASRPGRAYQSIISRKYDLNYINLGFSGACLAEDAIVDYICGLDMAAFVSDYDHNAPNADYLRSTHHRMYEKIRSKHPNIPYFMVTKPDFRLENDSRDRRAVVMESYLEAFKGGDRNVYFIDGSAFFNNAPFSELTIDRCHPNDEGFGRMAAYIGDVIAQVMDL